MTHCEVARSSRLGFGLRLTDVEAGPSHPDIDMYRGVLLDANCNLKPVDTLGRALPVPEAA